VDSVIEPFVSRAKILINTSQMSDSTSFNFYFYWRNDGNAIALMNVFSKLIINGFCSAQAAPCVLFTN